MKSLQQRDYAMVKKVFLALRVQLDQMIAGIDSLVNTTIIEYGNELCMVEYYFHGLD